MDQQGKEAIKKILQNSKGAGLGAGLLIAAGTIYHINIYDIFIIGVGAYGVMSSMFTGLIFQ